MNKILSFCIFIWTHLCLAQPRDPLVVKSTIYSTRNDTLKAQAYFELSQITKYQDVQAARLYADSSNFFYEKINFEKGIQERKYAEAGFLNIEGKYQEAIGYALEYEKWTKESKDIEREWYAVSMLATSYRESGQYEAGIKACLRGIDIGLQLKRDDENGFFYNDLGDMYARLKQWKISNTYFQKAYETAVKTKFLPGQSVSLRNIAQNDLQLNELDKAYEIIYKTFAIDSLAHYSVGLCRSYILLGKIEEQKQNYASAIQYYESASEKLINEASANDHAVVAQALARNYFKLNKITEAGKYLTIANEKLKNLQQTEITSENLRLNAEYLSRTKHFEEAYRFLSQYIHKNEKELTENISHQITGLNIQFETEKKENQINLLSTEKQLADQKLKDAHHQITLAILAASVFSILAYYVFWLWKKTRQQNRIIQKSLSEKETLLREIHHRVKNNLQFISSLLNLQARHVEDPKAQAVLKEGQNRVKSMALIHQNLYQEQNLTGIEVKKYLDVLIKNLFSSYNISPDRIKLASSIDPLHLDVDTMIPLGLILNELISNSLKYAFPSEKQGIITIVLKEENKNLLLEVRDNGIGISDHDKNQLGKSFGYRMINAFSNQLDADLKIVSGQGTDVILSIKDYKNAA